MPCQRGSETKNLLSNKGMEFLVLRSLSFVKVQVGIAGLHQLKVAYYSFIRVQEVYTINVQI